MSFSWRKIVVALVALQVILAVYLLIILFGGKTRIEVDNSQTVQSDMQADTNEVGKLGSLAIGNVEKARFVSFDDAGQVSREFGFQELLHKTGDEWKIAKPYLNIYQPQFDCRITADTGVMLADDLTDTTDIKEASLRGNVVVHITSKDGLGQMDIYLDDIEFITDRSLFLTAGSVKMLADDMQLLGTGMEIVYDYTKSKLEMFRIIKLESLCLNRIGTESESPGDAAIGSSERQESQISTEQGVYKAVFNSNVTVRMKNQFLLADDKLVISNIAPKQTSPDQNKTNSQDDSVVKAESVSHEKAFDVVASCRKGLVIYPMDVSKPNSAISSSIEPAAKESDFLRIAESPDVNSLRAETIDIDAITRRTTGSGRVILKYRSAGSRTVTITSQESFTFNPDSSRVSFEGGSTAVFDSQEQNQYTLTADQITAVLAKESYADELNNLKHITAMGNVTIVADDKQTGKETARFTAPRVDYFAEGSDIMSTGQSELTLYRQPQSSPNALPVVITAGESVRFEPQLNRVVFSGGCYCETPDENIPALKKYTLRCDALSIELSQQQNTSDETLSGIEKVVAEGSAVISVLSLPDANTISEFTANRVVYDSFDQSILAEGPSRLVLYDAPPRVPRQVSDAPMTLTSQQSVRYYLSTGRAVFTGLCVCNMIRSDNGTPRKYNLVAPQITVDIAESQQGPDGLSIESVTAGDNAIITVTPVNSVTELASFTAATINYNASADEVVADGPCDFTFYANDFVRAETPGSAVPVQIHAKQKTIFQPGSNRLTFKGDCIGTMVRNEADAQSRYTLSAPKLTAELAGQEQGLAASILGIDKFTADGGIVQISSVRTAGNKLLTFSKIKCQKFIYDTGQKTFTAIGPGIVTVDNSGVEQAGEKIERFSITKKCYAFLRDFENMKYDMQANRIVARNEQNKLLADYFPVTNNKIDEQIMASAGVIDIGLSTDALGRSEISNFRAFGGITYQDTDNNFSADEMIYDASTSTIRAAGSENQSCFLNGAIVDNIIYDINRKAVLNIDVTRPGMVQVPARR